jgi:hypothetical protein
MEVEMLRWWTAGITKVDGGGGSRVFSVLKRGDFFTKIRRRRQMKKR